MRIATGKIRAINSVEELTAFVKGDARVTVISAYKRRLYQLSEQN